MGLLWEHFVLNEVHARLKHRAVRYWRNKRGAEVDFVLPLRERGAPIAIECKWSADSFETRGLLAFRRQYPEGDSYVVASDVGRTFVREHDGVGVRFVSLEELIVRLSEEPLSNT